MTTKSRLTKRIVNTAQSGITVWDADIPGFGLRVSANGVRSYVLKYRRGPLQRWLTIGRHGAPWTPDEARREARVLLGRIEAGEDPAFDRREARDAPTLVEFAAR